MATDWISIATGDVENYLMAPQLNALRNAARGESQGDPLPDIIQDAVSHVRRKIASCARNTLDTDITTVPPSLKTQTIYVTIFRAQVRIPVLKLTEDQIRAYNNAETDLNRIASCTDVVEQPTDSVVSDSGGYAPLTTTPTRRFDHASQDGI